MNKNPVFIIITALSVIGLVIAVGIFTRLRLQNEAAIQDSHTPGVVSGAPVSAAPPAVPADGVAAPDSAAAAAGAVAVPPDSAPAVEHGSGAPAAAPGH